MRGCRVYKNKILRLINTYDISELNSRSAEMAFYIFLSIFPFLMLFISIIVYIPILQLNRYISILKDIIPDSTVYIIDIVMNSAIENKSLRFTIVSFIMTLWSSSRAVLTIMKMTNKCYKLHENRTYLKKLSTCLLFSFMFVIMIIFSMFFLVYGEKIGYFIFSILGFDKVFISIWNLCRYTIVLGTTIIILISLYMYVPNKKIRIKDTYLGALIATITWIIISLTYSYYINNFANYEVIYGGIAGIIILITWIYLSCWSVLLGCKFNSVIYFKKKKLL